MIGQEKEPEDKGKRSNGAKANFGFESPYLVDWSGTAQSADTSSILSHSVMISESNP